MKRWWLGFIGACAMSSALWIATPRADAEYPQYLFIHPNYGGYPQVNPAPAYAYGWFGVAPRRLWTFHWAYYGDRWIWH
jgi:hypothetical protein